MNSIHFQPGLSMLKFLKQFGTAAQYAAKLEQARRPQVFVRPCHAHTGQDAMSERETTLSSWPPSYSGHARTPDSGQLKHLDNLESIRSDDGDC